MMNQRWWLIHQFPSTPTGCMCVHKLITTWVMLEKRDCRSSCCHFLETQQIICSALGLGKKPDTKTSKLLFYSWGILLPSDFGLCIWISRHLQNDLNPGHTGSVVEPRLWCFLTSLLKCLMSPYALIGGNRGRMWLHLVGKVFCSYGSRRPHIAVYTISTAHSLVHEFLWFLICVIGFLHGLDASGSCEWFGPRSLASSGIL